MRIDLVWFYVPCPSTVAAPTSTFFSTQQFLSPLHNHNILKVTADGALAGSLPILKLFGTSLSGNSPLLMNQFTA